jgi:hypothetical protein
MTAAFGSVLNPYNGRDILPHCRAHPSDRGKRKSLREYEQWRGCSGATNSRANPNRCGSILLVAEAHPWWEVLQDGISGFEITALS